MNFLYALDAATGRPIPAFGEEARIDLRKGLGGDFLKQSIVLTSPGVVYKDLIIVGGRNPETPPAPPGNIRAFDVHTGKLVWQFRTIPHPGEPGYETWPKDAWKTAGAANNWAGMAVDPKRGVVYAPTGSAVPDFYGGARVGDDLWANCLLALDAATGKLLWHFQGVHHDIWDRDFPSAPSLITVTSNGRRVDAVAQTSKQGFVFLLDRDTGKPLFPVEERPVQKTGVPGETSAPTQPFPVLPEPFARQTLTAADLTTRSPEAHEDALRQFQSLLGGDSQFHPLSVGKQTIVAPGFDGGAEWGGSGVDPRTGVIYINANDVVDTGGLAINDPGAGIGLATYRSQCALCHRDNRAGSPPEFPSLVDVDKRLTREQIVATIHNGKGRMPSYPNLQDAQLEKLLEYLRSGKDDSAQTAPADTKELQHIALANTTAEFPECAKVYASQCAVCHGEHLEGITPGFPGLVGVQTRLTSRQIVDLVHTGKGRMPAFTPASISGPDMSELMRFLHAGDELEGVEPADVAEMNRYHFTGYLNFRDKDGFPAVAPPWGTLNAIDLNTGKYLWKVPLGSYPNAGKAMEHSGSENYGGPVVTAGGLVIIGATVFDSKVHIFDSRTGDLLWEQKAPYPCVATPTTYMTAGKQFIVIACGGSRFTHGSPRGLYVAFALP